jgi:hypothetical protein
MSNSADMFKKLAQSRQKSTETEAEIKTEEETKPVPKSEPSKPTPEENPPLVAIASEELNKKRGRPATGKRSDPDWIGRTYYVRKENDFDVEDELVKLKRAGVNLDKSELVDFLLAAWVKWRKGENIDIQMSEFSPRRKDELP